MIKKIMDNAVRARQPSMQIAQSCEKWLVTIHCKEGTTRSSGEHFVPSTKSRIWCEEKFKNIDSDQIEGAEFEFLGFKTRFGRNSKHEFLEFDFDF